MGSNGRRAEGIYARDANCTFNTASAFGALARALAGLGWSSRFQDPLYRTRQGKIAAPIER